jgi:hypothetical protein
VVVLFPFLAGWDMSFWPSQFVLPVAVMMLVMGGRQHSI